MIDLHTHEPYTFATDPMVLLMIKEAETPEDLIELEREFDIRETTLLAAQFVVKHFSNKE